ncbi:hypothetical protein [Variovorax ginsengisoli]|uniref:RiboL-PSP-HEPN domain-containing protein n=1 Tax=Variovorax ginsengisoli TaxID=363844 RepID=A0ABT9SBZ4_9BURK|nr:hypothetical protein [Variovorax ginsengisoli]MDP9901291.1 hypothetical protein [Variovorax ginsengisoli]
MRESIRRGFTEFADSARPIEQLMRRIQNESPAALRDADLRTQHHTIQFGSVVLLSGFLESFLRVNCENYFAQLSAKGFGMDRLGFDFLEIHIREGAGHLADMVKRESKHRPKTLGNSSAFVRRLVAPIADAAKSPAWEAFARTQGNPSAEVVKAVLQGLGIRGGLNSLEGAIQGRYSASTIEQLLKNFIELRNECAHSGSSVNVPQPSTILDLVYFMRILILGVCRLTDRKISELTGP